MTFEIIKENKKGREIRDWMPWLKRLDGLYMRCLDEFDYQPFHDHEQASVSLMVGAANMAGYLSLAECEIDKADGTGRGDLWMVCNDRHYWFEFKRSSFNPSAKRWGLAHALETAERDLGKINFENHEIGVAGVIAATNEMKAGRRAEYAGFASQVDVAVHFGPGGSRGAYLFLKLME